MNTPAIHKYNSHPHGDFMLLTEGYKEITELLEQDFRKYDLEQLLFARTQANNVLNRLARESLEQVFKDEGLDGVLGRFSEVVPDTPLEIGRLVVEENCITFNRCKKDGTIYKRGTYVATIGTSTIRLLNFIKRSYKPIRKEEIKNDPI